MKVYIFRSNDYPYSGVVGGARQSSVEVGEAWKKSTKSVELHEARWSSPAPSSSEVVAWPQPAPFSFKTLPHIRKEEQSG